MPLIPREELFGNPEKASSQISPDGKFLSWLAPKDGVLNIWLAPLDNLEDASCITKDALRGIRMYMWAKSSDYLLYMQDSAGDENWHIHAVDPKTGEDRDLTDIDGVNAHIMGLSWNEPDSFLVGLNDRDASWHDVYKINIITGDKELVILNEDEYSGFTFDADYNLKLAEKSLDVEGIKIVYKRVGEGWEEFLRIGHEDQLTTHIYRFDKSGESFYMIDSRENDKAALVLVSLADGSQQLLAQSDKADISDLLMNPTTYELEAWAADYLKPEWHVVSDSVKDDIAILDKEFPGEYSITSRTKADDLWIISVSDAQNPGAAWLYQRGSQTLSKLYSARPDLEKQPLLPMHGIVVTARDGLELPGYLTVPGNSDVSADMKPSSPVPMVLLVHGGPWARDHYGFNGTHQWLANRGYAVLSINFRGSTGFGKAFVNAADGEWSGKMHDDLIDTVDWAVEQGIADKDKVAIMGGSYGGYAALAGLTYTPEVFCCGVDIVGPSNLETLLETIPPYWKAFYEQLARRVGDPRTEQGLQQLKDCSPLHKADKITKPLLIGQGANDPRVKQAEADQIVDAMKANNLPVTYIVYPDEGHGWARPENRLSFNAVTEAFLAANLGGQAEPVGNAFEGSSIDIREGKEGIDGLG